MLNTQTNYPLQSFEPEEVISESEAEAQSGTRTPSPMARRMTHHQLYPSIPSIASPPPTSSPPESYISLSSSTYLSTPLGRKRRQSTFPSIKRRSSVSDMVSYFTNFREGYVKRSDTPSRLSDRVNIFEDLSSDSDDSDVDCIGATLVLEAARAQRNVRLAEKVLSKVLSEEHTALGRLYQFQAAKAEKRLDNAECVIGAVRNSMRNNGIPFDIDIPLLPRKRCRSPADSKQGAGASLVPSKRVTYSTTAIYFRHLLNVTTMRCNHTLNSDN
ncbi:hypothetical protein BU15DRAFT_67894 [Melanogaster broomeanus]|nr:hypothetical protein BU15DRAFT_67894 [Melanogaster broomeanus]